MNTITKKDKFKKVMKELGNLDLSEWQELGIGDIAFNVRWQRVWDIDLKIAHNLRSHAHVGIELPTGKKKNEDKAFSMPLGNDGAWGIPLGAGASCELKHGVHVGVDADMKFMLRTARERRMKKDLAQTEFLLLNKGDVEKKYGTTWSLEAFAQWRNFFKEFSCSATYQFQGHSSDKLYPRDTQVFPSAIVNSANSLRGWRLHNLQLQLGYDFAEAVPEQGEKPTRVARFLSTVRCEKPTRVARFLSTVRSWLWGDQEVVEDRGDTVRHDPIVYHASIFYKLPFSSRNVVDGHVVGGQVMVKF